MKTKDAELLIVRAQLETARNRVSGLETQEQKLLALGADPRIGKLPTALTTEVAAKLSGYLNSPAFISDMQKQSKVLFRAMRKQMKSASERWKPLGTPDMTTRPTARRS